MTGSQTAPIDYVNSHPSLGEIDLRYIELIPWAADGHAYPLRAHSDLALRPGRLVKNQSMPGELSPQAQLHWRP